MCWEDMHSVQMQVCTEGAQKIAKILANVQAVGTWIFDCSVMLGSNQLLTRSEGNKVVETMLLHGNCGLFPFRSQISVINLSQALWIGSPCNHDLLFLYHSQLKTQSESWPKNLRKLNYESCHTFVIVKNWSCPALKTGNRKFFVLRVL